MEEDYGGNKKPFSQEKFKIERRDLGPQRWYFKLARDENSHVLFAEDKMKNG
jgi:hypothetical protein